MRTELPGSDTTSATRWLDVVIRGDALVVLLLAIAAVTLRDVEAAAFAIGTLVGLSLCRLRRGLIGVIGLTLLSANVALWMGPGAFSNLTHGEGFWETALPSILTVAAITTFVACVADLIGRRTSAAVGRGPAVVQAAAAVLVAIAVVVSAVGWSSGTAAEPTDLRIVTEDVKFSDTTLDADSGSVGVFVANRDLFWHTFTIRELDVNLSVPVGAERRVTFAAAPGTYEFVCAIPGHTQAGMTGTLVVR